MRKKQKIINLYNDYSISNIKYVISIQEEDDLNQLWDFLNTQNTSNSTLMSSFISMFYEFAHTYILKNEIHFFELILEESEKNSYFTFWNKNLALAFENYLHKTSIEFILENKKISIKIDKSKEKDISKKSQVKEEKRHNKLILHKDDHTQNNPPYSFITQDDLNELLALSDNMQDTIYYVYKNGFQDAHFISLRSSLSMFCLTIRYYDAISDIANSITEFSNTINTNKAAILKLSIDELAMIFGLINNIEMWLRVLFVDGGADLYFMDNSIKADSQMISNMFDTECQILDENDNLDDIFNF